MTDISPERYVFKLFSRISPHLLKGDECLGNFYKSYETYITSMVNKKIIDIKNLTKTEKGLLTPKDKTTLNLENISDDVVLSFCEYFVYRTSLINDTTMKEICERIKKGILESASDVDTLDVPDKSLKLKTNRETIVHILSSLIDMSKVVEDDGAAYDPIDDATHDKFAQNLLEDLVNDEDMKSNAKNIKSTVVNTEPSLDKLQRELNLKYWRDCEDQCRQFMANEKMRKLLLSYNIIDTTDINFSLGRIPRFIANADAQLVTDNTFIQSKAVPAILSTAVSFINENPLKAFMSMTTDNTWAFVANENCIVPGGDSERGITSSITPLYYSSTYSVTAREISVYPLRHVHTIVMPYVLVFADPSRGYAKLATGDVKRINVIASPIIPNPPVLGGPINKSPHDPRLFGTEVRLKFPEKPVNQLTGIFNTARFFGYTNILLDDRCIIESNMPVIEVIGIFHKIITSFMGKFDKIVFAIENKKIYDMFRKSFGK